MDVVNIKAFTNILAQKVNINEFKRVKNNCVYFHIMIIKSPKKKNTMWPIFRALFPCVLCGLDHQQQHSLCKSCWQQLPWSKQTISKHERSIKVALYYEFPINRLIQQYKYEQQLHFQKLLLHCFLSLRFSKIQAIVPMPISSERLKQRGYNQMLIIAKKLAQHLSVPIWQPVIRLAQHSQKGLTRTERMENIDQQFQTIKSERRKFKRVLIIDDVVTTGSSIHALAHALETLGCQHIEIACIAAARTQKDELNHDIQTSVS